MDGPGSPPPTAAATHATGVRFWCAQCRAGYAGPGSCPHHTDEPLLDLGDEEVWHMLDEQDQRAKWNRMAVIGGGTAAITVVMTIALMFALDMAIGWTPNPARLAALIALATFMGGRALFVPRPTSPALADAQREALLALGRANGAAPGAQPWTSGA